MAEHPAIHWTRRETELLAHLVVQLERMADALELARMTDDDADWSTYGEYEEAVMALRAFRPSVEYIRRSTGR